MNQTMDQITASAASKASITAASTTALWGIISHELIFGLLGVLVAVLTMIINWYYKRKSDKLDEELKRKADIRAEQEAKERTEERALRVELMRMERGIPKYKEPPDVD